ARIGASETEVCENSITILFTEINAGNLLHDAVDIVVTLVADVAGIDVGGRTWQKVDVFFGADNRSWFEFKYFSGDRLFFVRRTLLSDSDGCRCQGQKTGKKMVQRKFRFR